MSVYVIWEHWSGSSRRWLSTVQTAIATRTLQGRGLSTFVDAGQSLHGVSPAKGYQAVLSISRARLTPSSLNYDTIPEICMHFILSTNHQTLGIVGEAQRYTAVHSYTYIAAKASSGVGTSSGLIRGVELDTDYIRCVCYVKQNDVIKN